MTVPETAALAALMLATVLPGCGTPDPVQALLACPDMACQAGAIVPAWQHDNAAAEAWLVALQDETVRGVLVEKLAIASPDDARRICDAVAGQGYAHSQCTRRNVRPHLSGGKGKGGNTNAAQARPSAPWDSATEADLAAMLAPCVELGTTICSRQRARELATEGDWEQAGAACLAGDATKDQSYAECLFQAAEATITRDATQRIAAALQLCTHTSFSRECRAHVIKRGSPPVVPAELVTATEIEAVAAFAEALDRAPALDGPTEQTAVDRFWADWVVSSFLFAERVDGHMITLLPEERVHHLRVGAAVRVVAGRDPSTLELDALVDELSQRLADAPQAAAPSGSPPTRGVDKAHTRVLLGELLPGEDALTLTTAMGPVRRALSPDPSTDLAIALLEAAAQLREPPPASFFLAVVGDETRDPLLRWTGARIGVQLDTQAAQALSDPDSLVRGRLEWTPPHCPQPQTGTTSARPPA